MAIDVLPRVLGLVVASSLMPIVGMATLRQPPQHSLPAPAQYESKVSDEAVMIVNYGDYGGRGNPYGAAPASYSGRPVQAGAFTDQLPAR